MPQLNTEEIRTPKVLVYLLCGYFFLSFFEPYYGAILGSVTKYYIFLVAFAFIYFNNYKIKVRKLLIPYLIWFAYKLISVIWARDRYIFQLHLTTHIGMILLLVCVGMNVLDKKTIRMITITMWLGSFIISLLSLFNSVPFLGETSRQVLQLFGQTNDPNNQAAFSVVGFAVALYCLFILKQYRVLSILTLSVNFLSTLLTGSRGGIVTLAAILITFLLLFMSNGKNKILLISLIAVLVIGGFYITERYLPQDVYIRLFSSSYEGGSDRIKIWLNALELVNDPISILFGSGWGSYWGYNGYMVVLHNTFLSILCDTGLVGFILFFFPIIVYTKYFVKNQKILPLFILVAGMVPCFFLEAINKRFFWNAIIYIVIFYYHCINSDDAILGKEL